MLITDHYDGLDSPFEGDRDLVLWRLPRDARISSARAVVTAHAGGSDTLHTLAFGFDDQSWGATHDAVSGTAATRGWAEVDFHARRTLVTVSGTNLAGTTLQADPGGGVWADVNERGALGGTPFFTLGGSDPFALPGLTAQRLRLTGALNQSPRVTSVDVRSFATNVGLSLGAQVPLWTHAGDLVDEATTPDFTEALQAFLEEAEVEGGFYVVPLTLHSDTIARLDVDFEFEIECRRSALPEGLDRVALRFDHGSVAVKAENPLNLALPSDARVLSTSGRAVGAFTESRVVLGPTGAVETRATAEVSPSVSQAQLLDLDEDLAIDAVDLLVAAVDRTVRLTLDLVDDIDGKPGSTSRLASPIGLQLERASAGQPTWLSAALPGELRLAADSVGEKTGDQKTWLVVQSLEGVAHWSAQPTPEGASGLQETRDGGLSWRRTSSEAGSLTAFSRLRHSPREFRMPLEIDVGEATAARRVSLRRFDAQERVDLGLDFPELRSALNAYLDDTAHRCPETEHVKNGDFERWTSLGATLEPGVSAVASTTDVPAEWAVTSGQVRDDFEGILLGFDDFNSPPNTGVTALSQVVPVSGGCTYELSFSAIATQEDALAELFWLGGSCGLLGTVSVPVRVNPENHLDTLLVLHRERFDAPAEATQAELRFTVPEGLARLAGVSLQATSERLADGDFATSTQDRLAGWELRGAGTFVLTPGESVELGNDSDTEPLSLAQTVTLEAGSPSFNLAFEGRVPDASLAESRPELGLRFLGDDGAAVAEPARLVLEPGLEARAATGDVAPDAVRAEVELHLPAGARLEVERVGLRFPRVAEVPLTFVAEAPGQLTVADLEVAWEPVATPAPPLPSAGLCSPTPPGFAPGELEDGACCCSCCGVKTEMSQASAAVTEAGRAALVSECPTCGESLVRFGGEPRPGAVRLRSRRLSSTRLVERGW